MYDLIVKNGLIVSSASTYRADIGIKGEKISSIGSVEDFGGEENAKRVIDADGKYVMPGIIDAHMHVEAPFQGCTGANDFFTQSISAAFGGVTTFMDFTNTFRGDSVFEKVKVRREEMEKSAIDFGIHGKFVEAPERILKEIEDIVNYGCPSFKLFMTYKKEGVMAAPKTLIKVFEKAKENNALPMVHAESNAIAELNIEKFEENSKNLTWDKFAKSKPPLCEAEAVSRSVYFSKYTGNALLIVHTTNKEALDVAKKAQLEDYPIYIETCPHYLTLFEEIYNESEGYLAICSPPLRTREEARNLWTGIKNGTISVTGSDDCTYSKEEKSMFLDKDNNKNIIPDFTKVVNGLSGIEIRFPLLLSEGVNKGKISMNKLCEITSTNIAKLFGCYPQKGIIAPGSDADIVIVDKGKEVELSADILHNNIDYCLHEGMKVKGYPEITISRGKVIVENGEFKGERGHGQFIRRKINPEILENFYF